MTTTRMRAAAGASSIWTAFVLAVGVAGPALAQDASMQPLLDRLERIERDVRLLNMQVSRGEVPASVAAEAAKASAGADGEVSGPAMARLAVRLTAIEEEVRQATGNAENLAHEISQLTTRLDKLVGDVDYRLNSLEASLGKGGVPNAAASGGLVPPKMAGNAIPAVRSETVPGSAPGVLGQLTAQDLAAAPPPAQPGKTAPATVASAPAAQPVAAPAAGAPRAGAVGEGPILPPGSVQDRYAFAFGLLRKADYDQAEKALSEFISAHGNDPLAHNAHYWLGETFYVRAQYARAAEVFLDAFQKSPAGAKAPDTLLKLGMSLAQLDKKKEACASFTKLTRDYPRASNAIKRTVQRESQRIGCQ